MAASSLTVLNEDFLTCNICFEIYKDPKILSCLHSFCRICLEKHFGKRKSSTITCPLCRADCTLPKDGVSGLKSNFFIQNLIEFSESTSTQFSGRNCSFCSLLEKENLAYSKCLSCRDFLCLECHNRHNFTTETINHETATLEDLQSGKHHEKLRSQQRIPCSDHPCECLRYFCDTCNLPVCRDCVILNHRDHKIISPSDAIKKRREEIGGLVQALNKKATALKAKSAMLKEQEAQIDISEDAMSQLIRKTVEEMVRKVRAEGKEAEEKVKAELQVQREEITRVRKRQDENAILLDSAMRFCRKVISDGLEGEIVFLQKMMRDRLSFLDNFVKDEAGKLQEWQPPSVQISDLADGGASLNFIRIELKSTVPYLNRFERYTDAGSVISGGSVASKTTLSKSFSMSTPNLLPKPSNKSTHSAVLKKQETKLGKVGLIRKQTITWDRSDRKITSIHWFDLDSFVVADADNGQVMHYNTSGKLLSSITLKNVITVACVEKVVYCGLKDGNIKIITGNHMVNEINIRRCGYSRPLVALKKESKLVAIGKNNLYLVDIRSKSLKSFSITNTEGLQIDIDAKFPQCFQEGEIIVSDWSSNVVYFIKSDGQVTNVYKRYDKGSYWMPGGLACDTKNNIFIGDYSRDEVTIIDSKCKLIDTIKLKKVKHPRCMACSERNELLITFKTGVALFQITHE